MDYELRVQSHAVTVPRTATYAVLGGDGGGPIEEIWLVCHGYGQLASRFIRRFDGIADGTRLIVAPEALSRFYLGGSGGPHPNGDRVGASWMTREERAAEIADQFTYLEIVCGRLLAGVDRSRVRLVALGFSQGTAVVCRWASATATPPNEIILCGGDIPADTLEAGPLARLQRSALTLVVGSRDPIVTQPLASAHRAQLDAAGLRYRFVGFDGGHEIESGVLLQVAAGFAELPARESSVLRSS